MSQQVLLPTAPKQKAHPPAQRHLNEPQTTGRSYRNLSQLQYGMVCDEDVAVPMRDDIKLLVDVYRPDADGQFPSLFAASCYPH